MLNIKRQSLGNLNILQNMKNLKNSFKSEPWFDVYNQDTINKMMENSY